MPTVNVYIAAYTIWPDAADDAAMQDWVTTGFRALEQVSKGSYLGGADLTRRSSKFMADANFARLQRLRGIHDPQGRFFDFCVSEVHADTIQPTAAGYRFPTKSRRSHRRSDRRRRR